MSFFSNRSFKFLLVTLVLLFFSIIINDVYTQPPPPSTPYTDSAHGSSSYGVKRSATGFPTDYGQGNCAHCHEQHASIGGSEPAPNTGGATGPDQFLLFDANHTSQIVNFCLDCHTSVGSYQTGGISINRSYSYNFGGNTTAGTYDSNILTAFSHTASGSSHWLDNIMSFALGTTRYTATGASWLLNSNLNPCDACHNPHIAKRNYNSPYDATKSAISRPSDHNNLWGDDSTERMSALDNYYRSPYWSSSSSYEPANNATYDGTNQPDYVKFCTDCHNTYNTIQTTNPRFPRTTPTNLRQIDWSATGDKHGQRDGSPSNLMAPYSNAPVLSQYTLTCLDCHEPHGSTTNIYLLRTEVNTKTSVSVPSSSYDNWTNFCIGTCHSSKPHSSFMGQNCENCHYHGDDF